MSEPKDKATVPAVDGIVMRLYPMDEAPTDGTAIVIKTREHGFNEYRRCVWVKPYSTTSRAGAWQWREYDCTGHITQRNALGWMHEPQDA